MHLPLILLAAGWSNALVIHDQETLQQVRICKKNLEAFDALFEFKTLKKTSNKSISSNITMLSVSCQ
ncbi:MAG: hypothetical protein ACK559_13215, partial [bacterium]